MLPPSARETARHFGSARDRQPAGHPRCGISLALPQSNAASRLAPTQAPSSGETRRPNLSRAGGRITPGEPVSGIDYGRPVPGAGAAGAAGTTEAGPVRIPECQVSRFRFKFTSAQNIKYQCASANIYVDAAADAARPKSHGPALVKERVKTGRSGAAGGSVSRCPRRPNRFHSLPCPSPLLRQIIRAKF